MCSDVRSEFLRTAQEFAYETSDCFSSSYATAVAYFGMDPRALGSDWGYRRKPRERSAAWPFGGIRIWRHSFDELVESWYGLHSLTANHATRDQAWRRIRTVLDEERPIIVSVDQHSMRHTMFYRLLHYPHLFVLVARRGREVLVVDGVRGYEFVGWMPVDEVLSAMETDHIVEGMWGFDGRNATIELTRGPACPLTVEALRTTLVRNIGRYLDRDGAGDQRTVAEFLDQLRVFPEGREEEPVDETLSSGALFVGELASQRQLNAAFLELCDERLDEDLAEFAPVFRWMSRELVKIRWAFFFGLRAGRCPRILTDRLADRLAEVTEVERDQMVRLRERLGNPN